MKMIKLGALAVLTFCCTFSVQARDQYTIEYEDNSPIKNVPLNNATLVLKVYDYQKPDGFKRVETNAKNTFSLNTAKDFEVVSIIGEKKFNARCSGSATTTQQKIKIRCEKF